MTPAARAQLLGPLLQALCHGGVIVEMLAAMEGRLPLTGAEDLHVLGQAGLGAPFIDVLGAEAQGPAAGAAQIGSVLDQALLHGRGVALVHGAEGADLLGAGIGLGPGGRSGEGEQAEKENESFPGHG